MKILILKLKKLLLHIIVRIIGRTNTYKLRYFHNRNRIPNFKKPTDLSERLISSILSPEFLKLADYADKLKVRDYVKSKGLESILLHHYGYWDNPINIKLQDLPEKFILKTNNGNGNHIICKDKSNFDLDKSIKKLQKQLNKRYVFENHYNAIKPMVFCEELIDTGTNSWPTDYKFTCINGIPYDIFTAVERETKVKYITFDMEWNVLPYTKPEYSPKLIPEKPKKLKEMIEIAKVLSSDFKFVRVDLYENNDKIFFGELTFSPWGGIMYSYTDEAIKLLGNKFI